MDHQIEDKTKSNHLSPFSFSLPPEKKPDDFATLLTRVFILQVSRSLDANATYFRLPPYGYFRIYNKIKVSH